MTTNGNPQQLSLIVNGRVHPCEGCGQLAVLTLEWYSPILVGPVTLARINPQGPGDTLVGFKMYTLCMVCLRREVYIPAWDNATKLPKWERTEVQAGPGHLIVGNASIEPS